MENELWLHRGKKFQRSGPDGVEAWRVAVAVFFIHFIMGGISRASGILYVEFIDAFQIERKQASMPLTIRALTRNLLGPVVGILGQKYGIRPVMILGGVVGALGTFICFFYDDMLSINVFWGCLSGIGGAMILVLTQAAINEYFVKHISTASGIALSGVCVGSFLFPAMFESLLDYYGIQGSFLFIAGAILHVIPAAMIIRKPTWLKKLPPKNEVLSNGNINSHETDIGTDSIVAFSNKDDHDASNLERNYKETKYITGNNNWFSKEDFPEKMDIRIDTDLLWKKRELVRRLLTNDDKVKLPSFEMSRNDILYENIQIKDTLETFSKIAKDTDTKSPTLNGDIKLSIPTGRNDLSKDEDKLIVDGSQIIILTQTTEFNSNTVDCLQVLLEKFFERDKEEIILLFPQDRDEDLLKIFHEFQLIYILIENNKYNSCNHFSKSYLLSKTTCCTQSETEQSNTFWSHIKTAMWLHTKPLFLLTCLCRSVHFLTFNPILTTIVDVARDKGLPEAYGKYTIGTLALGDLFGRLFSGWLTDKNYLSLPRYMFIFMVLQGIITMAIALTNSTESLMPVLTLYGLLQGCTFIRHPVLISHYLSKDEQSIAIGCLSLFPGIMGFAMPFYIGYFRDTIGSYNGIFYINGIIGVFIGCLWLAEPYLLKCSAYLPQRRQHIPV